MEITRGGKSVSTQPSTVYPGRVAAPAPAPGSGSRSGSGDSCCVDESRDVEDELRSAIRPVSNQQLTEAMQLLKYDIHREMQGLLKEQIRQFSIAKVPTCQPLCHTYT